jgi:mRNA interferase RelE/StbE
LSHIMKDAKARNVKLFEVELFPEAQDDLDALDDAVYDEVYDYFLKLRENPLGYSQQLMDLGGIDLRGYRKIYVAHATYRIIIKVEQSVTKIVQVIAVGERNKKKVYQEAYARIFKRN